MSILASASSFVASNFALRASADKPDAPVLVNDLHSRLNPTRVKSVIEPSSIAELRDALGDAVAAGVPVAIAGGRHSMGGQQFGDGCVLLDTRRLNRVCGFDSERGLITVEAGIQWPALVEYLAFIQTGGESDWGIVQKQTGADRLCLGGALSCNAHGRGLTLKPIVDQLESFELMDASGNVRVCSRARNLELFRLAIGGYGLFGVITSVTLRLQRRRKVRRVVEIIDTSRLDRRFEERINAGFLYGDFQFTIDSAADDFLRRGVFSCYEPVSFETPLTDCPLGFRADEWESLVLDAHTNKRRAFEKYSARYLASSGQVYWADAQLGSPYVDGYHDGIDAACASRVSGSEMITEVFVPRDRLVEFMEDARRLLIDRHADVIYGTVRLIEKEDETFLAWARDRFACLVFNLHVEHSSSGISETAETFRGLIDLAIDHGGSYYLPYHRWARRDQVLACYPQMPAFLAFKRKYDPGEVFQTEWYRHYRAMFGVRAGSNPVQTQFRPWSEPGLNRV